MRLRHRVHLRAGHVDRAMDEALGMGAAGIVGDQGAAELEFHDVVAGDDLGAARARQQEAVGIGRVTDADMAEPSITFSRASTRLASASSVRLRLRKSSWAMSEPILEKAPGGPDHGRPNARLLRSSIKEHVHYLAWLALRPWVGYGRDFGFRPSARRARSALRGHRRHATDFRMGAWIGNTPSKPDRQARGKR